MMKTGTIVAIGLAFLVAAYPVDLAAFQAAQDSSKGSIEGSATDALNKPLVGDQVRLLTPSAKQVAETKSGSDGKFSFRNVDPGKDYVVQIRRDGKVVGLAGNLEVKANQMTPALVTGVARHESGGPHSGFNFKRFVVFTVIITVVASVLVAKR